MFLLVTYHKYSHYFSDNRKGTNDSAVSIIMLMTHDIDTLDIILSISQVKSSHLYLYSAFNNTNCNKALHNIKIGKFVNNVK